MVRIFTGRDNLEYDHDLLDDKYIVKHLKFLSVLLVNLVDDYSIEGKTERNYG